MDIVYITSMLMNFPRESIVVGIGSMVPSTTCSGVTDDYKWTSDAMNKFVSTLIGHNITKISIWRADIAALLYKQPHYCGVEPWTFPILEQFIQGTLV